MQATRLPSTVASENAACDTAAATVAVQYWARSWFSPASRAGGHVNLGSLEARLAQPGGSVFALLLRDGAYAQGCKGYCYSRCHFRFDG